jgi:hypothetical protein
LKQILLGTSNKEEIQQCDAELQVEEGHIGLVAPELFIGNVSKLSNRAEPRMKLSPSGSRCIVRLLGSSYHN